MKYNRVLCTALAMVMTASSLTFAGDMKSIDLKVMQNNLNELTKTTRVSGSAEETASAENIKKLFESYGYEVQLQPFTTYLESGSLDTKGTNVIATKKANKKPNGDILVVSAHHDSVMGAPGADDDGSGVTAMLEIARMLADVDSDTEIRFLSFGGEEEGRKGSQYYIDHLDQNEKNHIIGDIQIDMLGYIHDYNVNIDTVNGKSNFIGNRLKANAKSMLKADWNYYREELSDHSAFAREGIPAVLIAQDILGAENHSTQDKADIIDIKKIEGPVKVIASTIADIMGDKEASLLKKAKLNTSAVDSAVDLSYKSKLWIGESRQFVENYLGQRGVLESKTKDSIDDDIAVYKYQIKWFGMAKPITTYYQFCNDSLVRISIKSSDLGMSYDEVKAMFEKNVGESVTGEHGTLCFDYGLYRKFFEINKEGNSYTINIDNSSSGAVTTNSYPMVDIDKSISSSTTPAMDKKLLELIKQVIPEDYYKYIHFAVYSDGLSGQLGLTTATEKEDNTTMDLGVDYVDAFDENGNFISYSKSFATAVHEFGHALAYNPTQVEVGKEGDLPHIFFPTESYKPDAYMRAFYKKFIADRNLDLDAYYSYDYYDENPSDFVDRYAETNISEEFAETFKMFVLTNKPTDDSIAAQKIRFFYDYPEMVSIRNFIRGNLGWK